jgi:hypoxanthine phosphoribosyltransferase
LISSALHRDDFAERGMAAGAGSTRLPFAIDGQRILLIDDVLYTGRTIRAAINELYDFGRPARVELAVLVDRAGASCRSSRPSPPPASRCPRRSACRWRAPTTAASPSLSRRAADALQRNRSSTPTAS